MNTDEVGSYTVTYSVSDANGNAAVDAVRVVNVVGYNQAGDHACWATPQRQWKPRTRMRTQEPAQATSLDGSLAVTSVSTVNTDVVGSYTVTYSVSDANGNAAADVVRTVGVVDTTKPVITLLGNATETVEAKGTYTDAGASASDTLDGNLTVTSVSTVNTDAVGQLQRDLQCE